MPLLTRYFIKASFIYFALALSMGLLQTFSKLSWELPPILSMLAPTYFHVFLFGWVTQLIFGVVYWMFPKYTKEKPRGYESLWQMTFICLNIGLVMRIIAEPIHAIYPHIVWGWLLLISAMLQWIAGMGFIVNTWIRVKER